MGSDELPLCCHVDPEEAGMAKWWGANAHVYFLGPGPPEQIDYPWRGSAANYAIIDQYNPLAV